MKPFMILNDGQTRRDRKETLKGRIEAFTNTCHDPDTGEFCETAGPGNPGTPRASAYDEYGRAITQSGKLHKNRTIRPPIVLGNLAHIPLTDDPNGPKAIIDKEDAELVGRYSWLLDKSTGYPRTRIRGTNFRLHELLLGKDKEGREWDHVNNDRLDNRRANLRPATSTQNKMNKSIQSNNKSGYKGVSLRTDTNKWTARIKVEGKYLSLGSFDTPEAAAEAYDKAAKKHFGEYANPNE